ncbi:MAG TPA: methyltransferase domain-containing protein [Gemmatimonadales bacterium]|nr:methyltransferase domain-containing protein [Gemmatimonadales bacterium]
MRGRADLERTVRFALGVAEHLLGRPVRSVLDVGCGEGRWQPVLQRLRPGSRYAGVDASEYVVRRFGRRRNIRLGSFGRLDEAGLEGPFDLVVCADVLHYVPTPELKRGLGTLVGLLDGVAYLETYSREDEIAGDLAGFQRRSAARYRRLFAEAGLVGCGLHCWAAPEVGELLTTLERAAPDLDQE